MGTRERNVAEETMSVMVKLANEIDEPYDIDLPTAECQSRTPFEERRVTHKDDASLEKKEEGARSRGACLDVENEAFQEKDGYMDDSRPVQGGGDTDERVMMPHTEKCEKSENYAKESQESKVKRSLWIQIRRSFAR